jgi:tetratricopeptide (TPR) repeat protein
MSVHTQQLTDLKKIFISYSWDGDGEENEAWVISLAERLKSNGIDVLLDKWHVKPGDPIAAFMQQAISKSDKVLMICTPRYKKSADDLKGAVGYETNIIATQIWLTADHRKYIAVLKSGNISVSIPIGLQGKCFVDLSRQNSFEQQYGLLVKALKGEYDLTESIFINNTDTQGSEPQYDYENLSFAVLEKLDKVVISRYINYFRKSVLKNPQNDKAYFGLGICALHYGMGEMALDKFEKALELNWSLAEYHYYYALSLCSKQSLPKLALLEIQKVAESIIAAIKLDACQAKYYCFLLLIYNSCGELASEVLSGWSLSKLQQQSRQHYRDENEIKRLASLVKLKNSYQVSFLFLN